jgi:hypothetical protein
MEQIGISHVGAIELTKDSLNKIMNTTLHGGSEKELYLNTTSLAKHLPVFKDNLGDDIPLKFNLTYKDTEVKFGETDDLDIVLDYTLNLEVSYDDKDPNFNHTIVEGLDSLVVFYDEIAMMAAFNVDM